MVEWNKLGHLHENVNYPTDGYGPAFDGVYELSDGTLWIGNGEYGSQVNYCPVCGAAAITKVKQGNG